MCCSLNFRYWDDSSIFLASVVRVIWVPVERIVASAREKGCRFNRQLQTKGLRHSRWVNVKSTHTTASSTRQRHGMRPSRDGSGKTNQSRWLQFLALGDRRCIYLLGFFEDLWGSNSEVPKKHWPTYVFGRRKTLANVRTNHRQTNSWPAWYKGIGRLLADNKSKRF